MEAFVLAFSCGVFVFYVFMSNFFSYPFLGCFDWISKYWLIMHFVFIFLSFDGESVWQMGRQKAVSEENSQTIKMLKI